MIKKIPFLITAVLMVAGCSESNSIARAESAPVRNNAEVAALREDPKMEKVMFGAGCFWGVEYVFRSFDGVEEAICGYAGGKTANPTYKEVCYNDTGHAEVIQVIYDPQKINFDTLLEIFWKCHDPTQVNRQGPDIGDQYRSVIFYYTEEQGKLAKESKFELEKSGAYAKPIATDIAPAPAFYPAEDYHQRYYEKKGSTPYCHVVPKLDI